MKFLSLDLSNAESFVSRQEMQHLAAETEASAALLESKKGPGREFLGWLDLPAQYNRLEFAAILEAAQKIRSHSEVLVVVGIGGSYLGAQAAITFSRHSFYNQLPAAKRGGPEIYFAGTNLSGTWLQHLLDLIGERDFSVNVVSKSGTTTEPAIAFRLLKSVLEKRHGKDGARQRIFATTDREKGALKHLADREGYAAFVVPDDIGGRYSVLSAVGLLPMAVAGIDIRKVMEGASAAKTALRAPFSDNPCLQYAAVRNALYRKGRDIELFIYYEPRFYYLAEWWKQLFGESEGKEGKGIFPAAAGFTTDLHSLGQYIQEGKRHLFETLLELEEPGGALEVEFDPENLDGLNYLAGKNMDFINRKAAQGTIEAHVAGGVPNLRIFIPDASPFQLGYLFYFFEKACAVSAYMLGVNPFDQPGVEAYKKNMFRLLGKK